MEVQNSIFAEFLNEVLYLTDTVLKFLLLTPISVIDLIVTKAYPSYSRIKNSNISK